MSAMAGAAADLRPLNRMVMFSRTGGGPASGISGVRSTQTCDSFDVSK